MSLAGTAAVVLHPHPEMGGDSSHPFVATVAGLLAAEGAGVITPDIGNPDVAAAAMEVAALADTLGRERVVLVGYSWGSVVTSHAAPARLAARILVAPPTRMALGSIGATPTLALVPENDQFGDIDALGAALAGTGAVIETIPGADHFLWGSIDAIAARCRDWLTKELA